MTSRSKLTKADTTASLVGKDDVLIPGAEAGRMLAGASRRKLRGLVEAGEFHAYALGGRTVYSRLEISNYIARLKTKPGRAPWRGPAADGDAR
jgi:hypothetical protein